MDNFLCDHVNFMFGPCMGSIVSPPPKSYIKFLTPRTLE